MSCRNRRMDGIKRGSAHHLKGFMETHAALHKVYEALNVAQGSVSLIAMIDVLLDAELLQRQNAADAQKDFLLQTILPVAAVKGICDGAVELAIQLIVRIQQVKLDTADVNTPYISMHHIIIIWHGNNNRNAVLVDFTLQRKFAESLRFVFCELLSLHRERLSEIAISVQETNRTEIDVRVRRLFQIVARKNAQTAGVDLQRVVKTVFHAKIRHGRAIAVGLNIHISTEISINLLHALDDSGILRQFLQLLVIHPLQEKNRILLYFLPQISIHILEKLRHFIVP